MEIFNHRQKMLDATNAMLSKENDNFATTVISTENVENIVEEVRIKNQTCFFSKLLGN